MIPLTVPSNAEKHAVWEAYHARKPIRVPLKWGHNSRVVMLDPALNPEGYTYEQMLHDPHTVLTMLPRWWEYGATVVAGTDDTLTELPAVWTLWVENHNIYDGAYFGAPFGAKAIFPDGQVPSIEPCLGEDDVDAFLAYDFASRPLDNPWIVERLAFREEIVTAAQGWSYLGRPGNVVPFTLNFDGPLTVATILFGADIFTLMAAEPEKARALLLHITRGAIARNRALNVVAGFPARPAGGGLADDSIQLISATMLAEIVLPAQELWFGEMFEGRPEDHRRGMHCCGDGTRHFRFLRDRLGIYSFDTGFPVDHGALRRELGPEVHISGGPHVELLRHGTPEQCYTAARDILCSGVMDGGRFSLREGNNLPPGVPLENLRAVYAACLECGRYERRES
jgi:hypothetical protein